MLIVANSGLAWHTEEGTLRQKFEEFGAVEEAVRLARLHCSRPIAFTSVRPVAPFSRNIITIYLCLECTRACVELF